MNDIKGLNRKDRILVTTILTIYSLSLIIWDYTHEGVPVHYLFESGDLPGISNWWGVIIIPITSWIILKQISLRKDKADRKLILSRFFLAVLFGAIISILFYFESNMVSYLMVCLFVLAFFLPLYKGEFFLGYIIGTLFSFGAFIPTLGALILMGILFLFYRAGKFVTSIFKQNQSA